MYFFQFGEFFILLPPGNEMKAASNILIPFRRSRRSLLPTFGTGFGSFYIATKLLVYYGV